LQVTFDVNYFVIIETSVRVSWRNMTVRIQKKYLNFVYFGKWSIRSVSYKKVSNWLKYCFFEKVILNLNIFYFSPINALFEEVTLFHTQKKKCFK